jgi:hypothetical protein
MRVEKFAREFCQLSCAGQTRMRALRSESLHESSVNSRMTRPGRTRVRIDHCSSHLNSRQSLTSLHNLFSTSGEASLTLWSCYANISLFMYRENNTFLKKWIFIWNGNLHSRTWHNCPASFTIAEVNHGHRVKERKLLYLGMVWNNSELLQSRFHCTLCHHFGEVENHTVLFFLSSPRGRGHKVWGSLTNATMDPKLRPVGQLKDATFNVPFSNVPFSNILIQYHIVPRLTNTQRNTIQLTFTWPSAL